MSKIKFIREYPLNASAKMLYPYLSTASGLQQWLCDAALQLGERRYNLVWDNQDHIAEMTSHRTNKSVRFTFPGTNKGTLHDCSYIDFSIETSELTQEQFLRIVDYTDVGDVEQLAELWDNQVLTLRELIGG
ncbi:START-like domain-containing protein [Rufibacter psychrotolerans]|uniref:START-like domain-containing protein n=1 Tax=Rufibacter psychrotolerans TaxID=2812556 RepID=UPI001968045C|nr:START-like domain-containing protein [Rufibacter sp. SYSU D00308]